MPTESTTPFTDTDTEHLLSMLARYALHYGDSCPEDMTIGMLATDLAQSMDTTTDKADLYRRQIEAVFTV